MATPEQFAGAMNGIQRQIAELTGHQFSGVATTFPALSWNKVPVAMFSSWFSCFATDVCCCTWKERTLSPSVHDCSTRHLGEIQGPHRRLNRMIKHPGEILHMSPRTVAQMNFPRSRIQKLRRWRRIAKTQKTTMVCWSSQESELDLIPTTLDSGDERAVGKRRGWSAQMTVRTKENGFQTDPVAVDYRNYQMALCTRETSCGKRRGFGTCSFSDGRYYENKGKNKFPGYLLPLWQSRPQGCRVLVKRWSFPRFG